MDDLLTRLRTQVERATDPIDPREVRTNRQPRRTRVTAAVVARTLVVGLDGTQEIALVFDGPLPDDQVTFVDDITSLDTGGLGYTVQGPLKFHVCQSVHSDGLAVTGSVDVLIPSDWFAPGTTVEQLAPRYDPPIDDSDEPVHHPGKIVACGPYHGYVQYSIWGPASDDANDVRLSVEDDSTRVLVEIRPEQA